MDLVSEIKVLRLLQHGPEDGMTNLEISREIIRDIDGDESNLNSIKVMVSRKTKDLVENGYVWKIGRRYRITEKGSARLNMRSFARGSYLRDRRMFSNIYVSFAVPQDAQGLIFENREVEEALEKLDKALENEEEFSMFIKRKDVSRET